jgi:hypothetical protein
MTRPPMAPPMPARRHSMSANRSAPTTAPASSATTPGLLSGEARLTAMPDAAL